MTETRCNICHAQVALPTRPPWWELFDVRFEDICEVCCEMQALYARPKAQYINVREEAQVAHPSEYILFACRAIWVSSASSEIWLWNTS